MTLWINTQKDFQTNTSKGVDFFALRYYNEINNSTPMKEDFYV